MCFRRKSFQMWRYYSLMDLTKDRFLRGQQHCSSTRSITWHLTDMKSTSSLGTKEHALWGTDTQRNFRFLSKKSREISWRQNCFLLWKENRVKSHFITYWWWNINSKSEEKTSRQAKGSYRRLFKSLQCLLSLQEPFAFSESLGKSNFNGWVKW